MIQKKTYVEYVTATGDSYKTLEEARYEQREELGIQVQRMLKDIEENMDRRLHMHLTTEQKEVLQDYLRDYQQYARLAALADDNVAEEEDE